MAGRSAAWSLPFQACSFPACLPEHVASRPACSLPCHQGMHGELTPAQAHIEAEIETTTHAS